MSVVEVSCPHCGAKLKAPDNMVGKKAKCKKCGKGFRVPGPAPTSETTSDGQALSVLAMPTQPLPDDAAEVLMAEPVAELPFSQPAPAPAPPPALASTKDIASLPSADPFDFGKSAKPTAPLAVPAPAALPAAPPAAKPTVGTAKAAPAPKPAIVAPTPVVPIPVVPAPAAAGKAPPAPAKPVAKAPPAPAKPVAKAAPEPLSLDDDEPLPSKEPPAKAKPATPAEPPSAAADNPFAFSTTDEKPAKSKRRKDDEDEDEDRPKKKRKDEEDEDDNLRARSRRRQDDEDEDDRPKKKRKDEEDEDDRPAKSKRRKDDEDEEDRPKKKRKDEDEPADKPPVALPPPAAPAVTAPSAAADNPFAFSTTDEKPATSKHRRDDEDEDEDRPKKKRRKDEDEEDDRPAKSKRRKDEDEEDDRPKKKQKGDDEPEDKGNKPPAALPTPAAPTVPAPSAAANPFAFSALAGAPADEKPTKSKRRQDDEDEDDRPKKKRKRDEDEPDDKPRYQRQQGGTGKALLITGVIGFFALALGITAVILVVRNNRPEPEPTKKEEKKEEPPTPPAPAPNPAEQPQPKVDPKTKVDPKKDKDPDPKKPKDSDPKKPKDPDPKKPKDPDNPPAPGMRKFITLSKLNTFAVDALPAKLTLSDQRKNNNPAILDVPLASVRRVFPPFDPNGDTCVLIQVAAAADGKNERLALESYNPSGNRVPTARIEYEGDGQAVPIADMHISTTGQQVFFLAAVGGKLHVWSLGDNKKIAAGVNPYADKPEHAKAGLAAAFFAPDPNQVVTVSTTGAMLLYDLTTRKPVAGAEFIPDHGDRNKVVLGRSVAKTDRNGSVVVAVAGVLYQVQAKTTDFEVVRKYDLGGDVGRSIALAASGTPGRLLYVFESAPDKTGKKDTAVLGLPLGDDAKHILFQLPSTAVGDPKGALWVNGDIGGVVTDRGVVWFDTQDEKFIPLVFAQPVTTGLYFGDDKHFWYVIPHTTMPTKSVVVAVSGDFNDRAEFQQNYPNKPLRTLRIDSNGLSK